MLRHYSVIPNCLFPFFLTRWSQLRRLLFPGAWEWAVLALCGCSATVQRRAEFREKGRRGSEITLFFFSSSICTAEGKRVTELKRTCVFAGETGRSTRGTWMQCLLPFRWKVRAANFLLTHSSLLVWVSIGLCSILCANELLSPWLV